MPHRTLGLLAGLGLTAAVGCQADTDLEPADARASLPALPYCDEVRDWPESWQLEERRALDLIDVLRARGADCGDAGRFPAAPSVQLDGPLTCAARVHAVAMAEQAQFGHTTPDEVETADRVDAVGYEGAVLEYLAAGPVDAAHLVEGVWTVSERQCAGLLSQRYIDVGLGFVGGTEGDLYATYWVAVLGRPPGS